MNTINIFSYVNNLNIEDVQFINMPVYYNEKQYQQSIQKVIHYLSKFKEIVAIYQIGGTSAPGISDIDLIVVFNDDVASFQHSYLNILDAQDRYLFMHSIYGMPYNVFRKRELLIPMYDFKVLMGKEIAIDHFLTDDEKTALCKIYSMEYLVINLFNLAAQLYIKQLKVRNLLCSLHALNYDFKILCNGDINEEQKRFSARLCGLRESWQEYGKVLNVELFSLCKETIKLAMNSLNSLTSHQTNPKNHLLFIQVGYNGYLVKGSSNNFNLKMEIIERKPVKILNKVDPLNIPNILRKQINDTKAALFATFIIVPPELFSYFNGSGNDVYVSAFNKRRSLLERYSKFMRRINSAYAIYDIFRWYHVKNLKWNTISSINKYLFLKNRCTCTPKDR